jgi:ArsR family transcriptional regulator
VTAPALFEMQARLCQAMSHPTRLKLVQLLRDGPRPVDDLAQATGLSQGSVSRHLAALRSSGVVAGHRQGQHMIYHLVSPKIVAICDAMREVLAEQAAHQSAIALALDEPASHARPCQKPS